MSANEPEKQNLTPPETPGKKPEEPKGTPEMIHEGLDEHKNDLAEFVKVTSETKEKNPQFAKDMAKLSENSPANIALIRRGGLDKEKNEQNRLQKHARLSSAYLQPEKIDDKIAYTVDFKGNSLAERHVGAGDLLPANIESIMVMDSNSNIVSKNAVRSLNNKNRIGYYDKESGQYIAVHSGFRIVVLTTRTNSPKTPSKKPKTGKPAEKPFIADPVLERRKISEDVALFNDDKVNTDSEDLHAGLDGKAATSTTKAEAKKVGLPESAVAPSDIQREVISKKDLRQKGYKPLKKVTPAVTREAVKCLKKGGPIDTVHYITIGGVRYAFHREWHKHASSDRRRDGSRLPSRLYRKHHGISVYAA